MVNDEYDFERVKEFLSRFSGRSHVFANHILGEIRAYRYTENPTPEEAYSFTLDQFSNSKLTEHAALFREHREEAIYACAYYLWWTSLSHEEREHKKKMRLREFSRKKITGGNVRRMGKIISFGIQKGGVGKTTTTGITAWLLAKDYKVLAVDFDSQGNLTAFLTQQNIYNFTKKTVLQACQEQDPRPYIHRISDNLHILTAEDLLSTFSRWLFREYKGGNPLHVLRETLAKVKEDYDFILIDLPPNMGEQTTNALTASDYAVIMLQTELWCYDALERYVELLGHVQEKENPDLQLAGILASMRDNRASMDSAILDKAYGEYGKENFFQTIITRRSKLKDFAALGISDARKDEREALAQYQDFVKELLERVN